MEDWQNMHHPVKQPHGGMQAKGKEKHVGKEATPITTTTSLPKGFPDSPMPKTVAIFHHWRKSQDSAWTHNAISIGGRMEWKTSRSPETNDWPNQRKSGLRRRRHRSTKVCGEPAFLSFPNRIPSSIQCLTEQRRRHQVKIINVGCFPLNVSLWRTRTL